MRFKKGLPLTCTVPEGSLPPLQAATPDSVDAEHSFEAAAEDSSGSDSGMPEPLAHSCVPTAGEPTQAATARPMDTEPSIEAAVEGSSAATNGMPTPIVSSVPGALPKVPTQAATPEPVGTEPSIEAAVEGSSAATSGMPAPVVGSCVPSVLPKVPTQAATPEPMDTDPSIEAAVEGSSAATSGMPTPLASSCQPSALPRLPARAVTPKPMDTEPSIEAAVEGSSAANSGIFTPMVGSCVPNALPEVPTQAATLGPMDTEPSVEAAAEGSKGTASGMPAPLAHSCAPASPPEVHAQVAMPSGPMDAEPSIGAAAEGSTGATPGMPAPLMPSCVPGSGPPAPKGGPLSSQQGGRNMATSASVASEPPQGQLAIAANSDAVPQDNTPGEFQAQGTVEPGNMAQTGQFFSRPYAACSQAVSCLRDALQQSRASGMLRLPGWAQLPMPRSPPALPDPDKPAAGQQPRLVHPWQPLRELHKDELVMITRDVNITRYLCLQELRMVIIVSALHVHLHQLYRRGTPMLGMQQSSQSSVRSCTECFSHCHNGRCMHLITLLTGNVLAKLLRLIRMSSMQSDCTN